MDSLGTEKLAYTIVLPHSLAQGQRHLLRAKILDAGFLLHFILNSKQLCIPVTAFLRKTKPNTMRPSPEVWHRFHASPGP